MSPIYPIYERAAPRIQLRGAALSETFFYVVLCRHFKERPGDNGERFALLCGEFPLVPIDLQKLAHLFRFQPVSRAERHLSQPFRDRQNVIEADVFQRAGRRLALALTGGRAEAAHKLRPASRALLGSDRLRGGLLFQKFFGQGRALFPLRLFCALLPSEKAERAVKPQRKRERGKRRSRADDRRVAQRKYGEPDGERTAGAAKI